MSIVRGITLQLKVIHGGLSEIRVRIVRTNQTEIELSMLIDRQLTIADAKDFRRRTKSSCNENMPQ